jgi:hypothetical protein
MINRGGSRYAQTLAPDEGQPVVDRACFDTHNMSADWRRHYYWHNRHGLQDVIRPDYWGKEVIGNLHPGDIIHCELGELGERLFVDLGVTGVGHKTVEVSIVRRDKETRVSVEHFADESRAKSRRIA